MPTWVSSVVRVISTTLDRDYDNPWQAKTSTTRGSAVAIAPGLLLTNADVVANASYIEVQRPGRADKAIMRVKAVNHDCDLALLDVVARGELLADLPPAELGATPDLWDPVAVVGYPESSESPTVIGGAISKIAVERYSHAQRHALAMTIDADVGEHHGGGPVFRDDKLVGFVMQRVTDEAASEMIPVPIVRAFLAGVRAGKPAQLPVLGAATQTLENRALRAQFGLGAADEGVLVIRVAHGESADGVLARGDVITAIDGRAISSSGSCSSSRTRCATTYCSACVTSAIGARSTSSAPAGR